MNQQCTFVHADIKLCKLGKKLIFLVYTYFRFDYKMSNLINEYCLCSYDTYLTSMYKLMYNDPKYKLNDPAHCVGAKGPGTRLTYEIEKGDFSPQSRKIH